MSGHCHDCGNEICVCGDAVPTPKTRAAEVAPGVFVAPEGYTGPVQLVSSIYAGSSIYEPHSWIVCHGSKTPTEATAAEVAAKLWPVESPTSERSGGPSALSMGQLEEVEALLRGGAPIGRLLTHLMSLRVVKP